MTSHRDEEIKGLGAASLLSVNQVESHPVRPTGSHGVSEPPTYIEPGKLIIAVTVPIYAVSPALNSSSTSNRREEKMGPRWGPYVLILSQPKRYLNDR